MNKKILIVSASFYPMNSPRSFRTTELVKEFSRQGHEVTVLISKDTTNHPKFEKEHNVKINNLGSLKYKRINLNSGSRIAKLIKRLLRRSLDLFFHYPNIEWMFKVKRRLRNEKNYDLLISVAAPHAIHWGVAWAWNKKKSIANIWVADCGDPFMGTTTDTFKKMFYFKYIEKWWCRKADFISVPFSGAIDGYYKQFHQKIKVIPQGFNFEELVINKEAYVPNKIPTFAYAGGLIPGVRDPKKLIEYLLDQKKEFKFIFYTNSIPMISSFLKKAKGKIEVRDYIPRNDLILELSKMDFVVNFANAVATQLPSKLIDYYLTKRPVLSIESYSLDKEVIKEFLEGNYTNKYKFHDSEQYRIENVCQQFLTL